MLAAKVRGEQRGPFDRAVPFLYPLLHRAALIVEGDDALGRPGQVDHDEADAMPQKTFPEGMVAFDRSRRSGCEGWQCISGNLSPPGAHHHPPVLVSF